MGFFTRAPLLVALAAAVLGSATAQSRQVIRASGSSAADIADAFKRFSKALGGEDNGSGPPAGSGRRSINWDADAVPFAMPFDFFNTQVPRGAVFRTRGRQFRVSNPPPVQRVVDNRFTSLNRRLALQLKPFSAPRLFTPLRNNKFSVRFQVPGKPWLRATTRGFGAVFLDVDRPRLTTLTFYNRRGQVLRTVFAQAAPGGLSFVGAVWPKAVVARVRVKLGNRVVTSSEWGKWDVVVCDDFVYGEPVKA